MKQQQQQKNKKKLRTTCVHLKILSAIGMEIKSLLACQMCVCVCVETARFNENENFKQTNWTAGPLVVHTTMLLPLLYKYTSMCANKISSEISEASLNMIRIILKSIKRIKYVLCHDVSTYDTYPCCCANAIGTSMLFDALRRSFAISASFAKSVSRSWSAKRAERLDSNKRTSSRRFFTSIGGCKNRQRKREMF